MSATVINFSDYMDNEPTPQQKALWDKFVEEYVKDFNSVEAAMRIGFNVTFAVEYGRIFLGQPYVQRLIMKKKMEPVPETEDEVQKDKSLIIATLRETMLNGQPATRVVAAKTLAGIHGLDQAPDRSSEELEKLVNAFKDVAKHLPD